MSRVKLTRRKFLCYSSNLMLVHSVLPNIIFADEDDSKAQLASDAIIKSIKKQNHKARKKGLTILYPKGSLQNLVNISAEFEKLANTSITLIESSLNDISSEMILNHRLKNKPYDIALPPTFNLADLAEDNVIYDLTDLASQYEPDGLLNNVLYKTGNSHKDRFYGYQTDGDAYMMFYNGLLLSNEKHQKRYEDEFGEPLTLPSTWYELDKHIRFFKSLGEGQYGGSLFRNRNYIAWEFWLRLHSKGIYPVNEEMEPKINTEPAIQALEEMISINQYLAPDVYQNNLFENFSSYSQGNKYCNLGWGGTLKYIHSQNSILKDNLFYSPSLGGQINDVSFYVPFFNWGWNYVLSSESQNKELAYLFCLFASTPEMSTRSIQQVNGFFDPYREEHYSDKNIISIYGKDFLETHKYSLLHSIPDFYIRGRSLYLNALSQGVYAASQKQVSIELALNSVADKWRKITEMLGEKEQKNQWRQLKSQYPDFFKRVVSQ